MQRVLQRTVKGHWLGVDAGAGQCVVGDLSAGGPVAGGVVGAPAGRATWQGIHLVHGKLRDRAVGRAILARGAVSVHNGAVVIAARFSRLAVLEVKR